MKTFTILALCVMLSGCGVVAEVPTIDQSAFRASLQDDREDCESLGSHSGELFDDFVEAYLLLRSRGWSLGRAIDLSVEGCEFGCQYSNESSTCETSCVLCELFIIESVYGQ